MAQRLLNFRQFRECLGGIAPSRTYELLAAKLLPIPLRIGRRNFWVQAEVDKWIEGLAQKRDSSDEPDAPVIPVMRRRKAARAITPKEIQQITEGQALAPEQAEAGSG